jgi:serine/threonine protein kinase
MPFDDSDIKKMIEAQISKGGLRFGSEGSPEVQDLIVRMLQPEVTQRWPIELVQKHSWFGRQMNTENQTSSISYVTATTTTNRGQEQGGIHQMQKRQGPPVYV